MMKDEEKFVVYALGVVVLAAIVYLAIGNLNLSNLFSIVVNNPPGSYQLPDQVIETPGFSAMLTLSKYTVCRGETIIVSLATSFPNGQCNVFVNPNSLGWQYLANVPLDGSGAHSQSQLINVPAGVYLGQAVCNDASGNAKLSNIVTLRVNDCSSPPPDDGTDGQDGTDGGDGVAPPIPCNAVWNPTPENCAAAVCTGGDVCVYYPDTGAVMRHCGCAGPSCDTTCKVSGYSTGVCHATFTSQGVPVRNPCIGLTRVSAGDKYCPLQSGTLLPTNEACCCG